MSDNYSDKKSGDVLGNLPSLECLNKIARTTKNKASFNHFEKKVIKKRNLAFFAIITLFAFSLFALTIKSNNEQSIIEKNSNNVVAATSLPKENCTTQSTCPIEKKLENNILNEDIKTEVDNSQHIAQEGDSSIEASLAENFSEIVGNNEVSLPEKTIENAVVAQQNESNQMHIELQEISPTIDAANLVIQPTEQNNLDTFKISLSPLSDVGASSIDDLDIGEKSNNNNFLENILLRNSSAIARDSFDSQEENFIESQTGKQFSFKKDAVFSESKPVDSAVQNWLAQQKVQGVAFKGKDSCIVLNSKIFHVGDLINNDLYVVWSDIDPDSRLLYFVDGHGSYYAAKY